MIDLYQLAERVAASGMSVLILGETGVGKELVAERIHACSPVAIDPFCGSTVRRSPKGYWRASFSGTSAAPSPARTPQDRPLRAAPTEARSFSTKSASSTMETQAKLLRVLETGEVTRVGSHQPASGRADRVGHQPQPVRANRARPSSARPVFRLNGVSLTIPLVRDRPATSIALAEFFAERCATMMATTPPVLSEEAKTALLRYRWPGNVRELKNVIERAVVLTPAAPQRPPCSSISRTAGTPRPSRLLGGHRPRARPRRASALREGRCDPSESFRAAEARVSDTMESRVRGPRARSDVSSQPGGPTSYAPSSPVPSGTASSRLDQAGNQAGAAKLLGLSVARSSTARALRHSAPPQGEQASGLGRRASGGVAHFERPSQRHHRPIANDPQRRDHRVQRNFEVRARGVTDSGLHLQHRSVFGEVSGRPSEREP